MLRKLSDEIRYAQQRAADAADQATKTSDPETRRQYLDMERRWLKLARSYDVSERLGSFIHHQARQSEALRVQVPVVKCPACTAPMRLTLVVPHDKFSNLD